MSLISSPSQNSASTVEILQQELEATSREVMILTLELEQRVAERTAELARSNQKLLKEMAERIRAEAEIKKLNRDLARRADLLEAANQELEAFSSSVSHDLRNPLARILGFASILKGDAEVDSAKTERCLSQIQQAARQMTALIDDLLRLAHSSQVELIIEKVELNSLVEGIIQEIGQHGINQTIEWIRWELPTVSGDVSLLRQVFVNLLSNAVKYSRTRDHIKIEIGCTCNQSAGEWEIFVRDNGVGFDPARAGKLFGAFQRLHSTEDFEGTGIGLANVRRIVLRHGGKVWANSRPDEGAAFYITLPQ